LYDDSTCGSATSCAGTPRSASAFATNGRHFPERTRPARKRSARPAWKRTFSRRAQRRVGDVGGPLREHARLVAVRPVALALREPSRIARISRLACSVRCSRARYDMSSGKRIVSYTTPSDSASWIMPEWLSTSV
jgi:hypothetical protein